MKHVVYIVYGVTLSAEEAKALPKGITQDDLKGNTEGELCLISDGVDFIFGYYAHHLSIPITGYSESSIELHDGDFAEWERCFKEELKQRGLTSDLFDAEGLTLFYLLKEVNHV